MYIKPLAAVVMAFVFGATLIYMDWTRGQGAAWTHIKNVPHCIMGIK